MPCDDEKFLCEPRLAGLGLDILCHQPSHVTNSRTASTTTIPVGPTTFCCVTRFVAHWYTMYLFLGSCLQLDINPGKTLMTEKSISQNFQIYFDNAAIPTSDYCAAEQ